VSPVVRRRNKNESENKKPPTPGFFAAGFLAPIVDFFNGTALDGDVDRIPSTLGPGLSASKTSFSFGVSGACPKKASWSEKASEEPLLCSSKKSTDFSAASGVVGSPVLEEAPMCS
jgi:hypothetical protein